MHSEDTIPPSSFSMQFWSQDYRIIQKLKPVKGHSGIVVYRLIVNGIVGSIPTWKNEISLISSLW